MSRLLLDNPQQLAAAFADLDSSALTISGLENWHQPLPLVVGTLDVAAAFKQNSQDITAVKYRDDDRKIDINFSVSPPFDNSVAFHAFAPVVQQIIAFDTNLMGEECSRVSVSFERSVVGVKQTQRTPFWHCDGAKSPSRARIYISSDILPTLFIKPNTSSDILQPWHKAFAASEDVAMSAFYDTAPSWQSLKPQTLPNGALWQADDYDGLNAALKQSGLLWQPPENALVLISEHSWHGASPNNSPKPRLRHFLRVVCHQR